MNGRAWPRLLLLGLPFGALGLALALILACAATLFILVGGRVELPTPSASVGALADIPPHYLALYQGAGAASGIDWAILAAIGKVESDHGRSPAPGVRAGFNVHGCCAGPMQFFANRAMASPTTWDRHGVDGNRDGRIDVYDPADAIPAAAAYLRASGAPGDYDRALFAYNRAGWYVARVRAQAARYRSLAPAGGPAAAGLEGVHPAVARLYAELEAAVPGEQYVMSGLRPGATIEGSGRPSLHASGLAVDIGTRAGSALGTTLVSAPDLDAIAVLARRRLGHPPVVAGVTSSACGEVLWRTWSGGNHWHHVHVGLEPACLGELAA